MTLQKPKLIIIPGLGDRVRGYSILALVWKIFGYDTHIFSFRWESPSESFSVSFSRLLDYIDEQSGEIYIIGASAGGAAAIHALYAREQVVQRVVTIATVSQYIPSLKNSKLKSSVENLPNNNTPEICQRILSVYGVYDQKVPVSLTKKLKARHCQIPMIGHALIIFTALTVYSYPIHSFLRKTRD